MGQCVKLDIDPLYLQLKWRDPDIERWIFLQCEFGLHVNAAVALRSAVQPSLLEYRSTSRHQTVFVFNVNSTLCVYEPLKQKHLMGIAQLQRDIKSCADFSYFWQAIRLATSPDTQCTN